MTRNLSILGNLLLASTLFWAVPTVEAEEISRVPTDSTAYCHLAFPTMREHTLSMDQPIIDPLAGDVVDFYGPCDYNPVGFDEIHVQRRMNLRGNLMMEIER